MPQDSTNVARIHSVFCYVVSMAHHMEVNSSGPDSCTMGPFGKVEEWIY